MEEIDLARKMRELDISVVGDISPEAKAANLLQALFIVIPPRGISDRSTFSNLVKYYAARAAQEGEEPDYIYRILIGFALESSGPASRNPAAVFMSIVKKELSYDPSKGITNSEEVKPCRIGPRTLGPQPLKRPERGPYTKE